MRGAATSARAAAGVVLTKHCVGSTSALHHLETKGHHCLLVFYRGIIPGFLGWCEMDFANIDSITKRRRSKSVPPKRPSSLICLHLKRAEASMALKQGQGFG